MKTEHEIMMERLQKWRTEKGKPPPAATKRPATSGAANRRPASNAALGRDGKPGGVSVKKPLCTANAKNMTVKTAQKKQSLKKRGSVKAIKGSHAAVQQPQSPDMPMSKKLELWRAQKEKEASTQKKSATKRPWRGSGTPAVNPTKQAAKQTPASVSHQCESSNSTQKRRSCTLPAAQSSTADVKQHTEQDVNQDCSDMVPPTRLTFSPPSKALHDLPNSQYEPVTEQVSHGSESDQPINSSVCSNSDNPTAETGQELVVDGLQYTESEQVSGEEDECDFMLRSSQEPIAVEKQRRVSNLATPKNKSSRKSQTPRGKRSVCKSAMKQVNRVGGALTGEQRSVKFTTPVRCSPRLAKVGEGVAVTPSNTPKNKDMRDRLQQWLQEKGKTPSRYSHLLNFQRNTPADRLRRERRRSHNSTPVHPNHQSANEKSGTGFSTQAEEKLNATLDECLALLHEGCPVDHVNNWLDDICRRLPMVEQCAKYWLCRATATELDRADYHDVVGVFEDAAEAGAQPVDEIKEALKEFVMRMGQEDKEDNQDEEEDEDTPVLTPMDVMQSHTLAESQKTPKVIATERDTSSVVKPTSLSQHSGLKYCLMDTTPLFKRTNSRAATPYYTPGLMITPVRRSVRLEKRRSFLPDNLKDHDVCVNSLQDLPSDAPTEFILRYNRALEDEFDEDAQA